MKQLIKRLLPASISDRIYLTRLRVKTAREFKRDQKRYLRHFAPEDRLTVFPLTGRSLEAQVTKDYHRVEKALTLPAPAARFGDRVGARLSVTVPLMVAEKYDPALIDHATTAQDALRGWNEQGERSDVVSPVAPAAARPLTEAEVQEFFTSRHSVRDFDPTPVPQSVLDEAVSLALRTPSVCNRQAWFVRFAQTEEARTKLLKYQNGSRGFGASSSAVALITADARMFAGPGERNQGWIDGGLFAMSLVWALHGLGVGSCMLNMSTSNDKTEALRAAYGIPDHELVIMMIAIGYPSEGARMARSPRRALDSVLLPL